MVAQGIEGTCSLAPGTSRKAIARTRTNYQPPRDGRQGKKPPFPCAARINKGDASFFFRTGTNNRCVSGLAGFEFASPGLASRSGHLNNERAETVPRRDFANGEETCRDPRGNFAHTDRRGDGLLRCRRRQTLAGRRGRSGSGRLDGTASARRIRHVGHHPERPPRSVLHGGPAAAPGPVDGRLAPLSRPARPGPPTNRQNSRHWSKPNCVRRQLGRLLWPAGSLLGLAEQSLDCLRPNFLPILTRKCLPPPVCGYTKYDGCITSHYPAEAPHEEARLPVRVHADRAVGGDRHHRHPDRPVVARGAEGARGRRPHAMYQQPQADWPGSARLSRRQESVSSRLR